MIETQIKNALDEAVKELQLKFEDLTPILHVIASLINEAFRKNFDLGGRWSGQTTGIDLFSGGSQQWSKWSSKYNPTLKHPNASILVRSGVMRQQIEVREEGTNQISISASTPYAAIHQFGGVINHPGRTPYIILSNHQAHFISKKKAAELEAEGRKVKVTKPHQITIPPRPFLVLSEDDVNEIAEVIKKYI